MTEDHIGCRISCNLSSYPRPPAQHTHTHTHTHTQTHRIAHRESHSGNIYCSSCWPLKVDFSIATVAKLNKLHVTLATAHTREINVASTRRQSFVALSGPENRLFEREREREGEGEGEGEGE